MSKVIVFGATGSVGSHVAQTAKQLGAETVVASRSDDKKIPGLGEGGESGFTRVKADLDDAESVTKAVKDSGAKRAFIYLSQSSQDHMRAALEALKSAGVEFVVFLSGFSVSNPREASPSDFITFVHAQVEIGLEEVFGPGNFVAVRAGVFASNVLRHRDGIIAGEVSLFGPEMLEDEITPGDIGAVAGNILVKGPQDNQQAVYVHGPQLISTQQAIETVGKVIGKDIQVKSLTAEQAVVGMGYAGIPKPVAESLVKSTSEAVEKGDFVGRASYDEGVGNVKKYKGADGESFQHWVESNKFLFAA